MKSISKDATAKLRWVPSDSDRSMSLWRLAQKLNQNTWETSNGSDCTKWTLATWDRVLATGTAKIRYERTVEQDPENLWKIDIRALGGHSEQKNWNLRTKMPVIL